MPSRDLYHEAVKTALIKDGWIITADPYRIVYEGTELYADLSAEHPIAARLGDRAIVVEIKSFVGRSLLYDFHGALGQYIVYRQLIRLTEPKYELYLAIDEITYENFLQRPAIQVVLEENRVFLIVVDIEKESIVLWKN